MSKAAQFNASTDIPSLHGKVILITGGTAGLGAGSVATLVQHGPAHIFFSGRNEKSAKALIKNVQRSSPNVPLTFIKCDIASLVFVQEAAQSFTAQATRLDILMLNAGIMAVDAAVSPDGYEIQWATNHLGHALLVKLLMPLLQSTARAPEGDARIINMTSVAYQQAPKQGIDFATLASPQAKLGALIPGSKWSRYGQSKLAQLLYSQELAKHFPEVTSVSVHPGVIMTGLFEKVDFLTKLPVLIMSMGTRTPVEKGHFNQCWAATCGKSALVNGEYYEPIGVVGNRTTRAANDTQLAGMVWDWTQKALEKYV